MKVNAWSVSGFRSFGDGQMVRVIDMKPGLWHVTGPNGVGKSSLFEALYWGCYGHTSRNLRGPVLRNWDSKGECDVQIGLDIGNIHRTHPPSLHWNEKPIDQEELDKLLILSSAAFLHSIYFAQFTDQFVDLKPEPRMEMYASVMNLEFWERASDEAVSANKALDEQLHALRETIAGLASRIETLGTLSFKLEAVAWVTSREGQIEQANTRIRCAKSDMHHTKKQLDKLPTTEKRDAHMGIVNSAASECARLSRQIETLEKRIKTAESNKGPRDCPTCGAKMTVKHAKVEVGGMKKELEELREEASKTLARHDDAMRSVAKLNDDYKKRIECEKQLSNHEQVVKESERELDRLRAEIKDNPYTERERKRVADLKAARDELKEAETKLDDDTKLFNSIKYWVKGYKDLRLSLIEESLEQLNLEINECVNALGLEDWKLVFDVERETKRGTIKRGFQCLVKAPNSPDLVPWEVWSGGESQRLRLATSMGMSNLIASRTGVACNIEVWDEPSVWLNDVGIQDLLDVLCVRAEMQQKVIFIADHRALGYGSFAGTVKVDKGRTGSLIKIRES
jgi:DNA repair exonuclease SbcCD ATPase subunit